ncbi:MAG: hydroxymethylglutaryl-CoA reductase, partial [bacterium]|nr:hydroxymethylglutaryl-CoA reductase [bacterium]
MALSFPKIPSMLLKQLYTFGSLKNNAHGVQFSIKNRLSDATIREIVAVKFNNQSVSLSDVTIKLDDGSEVTPEEIANSSLDFPLRRELDIYCAVAPLPIGKHKIEIHVKTKPFGDLKLKVDGAITEEQEEFVRIPRSRADNFSEEAIKARQKFVENYTDSKLEHITQYSFDPHTTAG